MSFDVHTIVDFFSTKSLAVLVFLCCAVHITNTQTLHTGKITYVTSTSAYVNLGTRQGFDVGDTLTVSKSRKHIATLIVTNLSSNSLVTTVVSKTATIIEGDHVEGRTRKKLALPVPMNEDTLTTVVTVVKEEPKSVPTTTIMEQQFSVRGRVSMQYYALMSNQTVGMDFSQPALALNLSADNLFSLPLQMTLYSNHRYDARSTTKRPSSVEPLSHRIHQISLQYGRVDGPLNVTVGRFIAPVVGGIGSFDGAMIVARNEGWEAGIAAGSQPGYTNSGLNFDDPKLATYIGYRVGDWQSFRYQGSLAFSQIYKSNTLDRGFFYLQNSFSLGSVLSVFQNANVDLYDVPHGGSKTNIHLSDFFLSATYRPLRWFTTTASYAVRRNVYFLRSYESMPDSLFGTSPYRNAQLSVGASLPLAMFVSLSGSLRGKQGDTRPASALMGRYSWSNVLRSQLNTHLSANISDNIYSRSSNAGIELNRDFDAFHIALRVMQYRYDFTGSERKIDRTSTTIDCTYRINTAIFVSFNYERYWESSLSSDRIYSEFTVRL